MGADLSAVFTGEKKKKKKVKGERFYKPPDKRLKERFDPEENLNFTSQLDAAIDKVRISLTYHFSLSITTLLSLTMTLTHT